MNDYINYIETFDSSNAFKYTQNIIVRLDLNLSRGKLCAQVAHAAVEASENARVHKPIWWEGWMKEGQRKIVLYVNTLEELLRLKCEAEKLNLPIALIKDKGLTELPPETVTCLAIGPAPIELVDKITGKLKLLK
ncbi:MAG: peptidyl-tRNA hydrolase Pth2 [Candidatus Bathyarchaeia archaeon]|nr:peptidyl-tRNA hydrolase Pth2 [Candidatus Bathyarchaeota archaeon]